MSFSTWVAGARPRTLPAAAAPILAGGAAGLGTTPAPPLWRLILLPLLCLGVALAPGRSVAGVRLQALAEDDAFREIGLSWAAGRRMLPSAALFRDHVLGLAKSRRLPRPPGTFDEEHPLKSST